MYIGSLVLPEIYDHHIGIYIDYHHSRYILIITQYNA